MKGKDSAGHPARRITNTGAAIRRWNRPGIVRRTRGASPCEIVPPMGQGSGAEDGAAHLCGLPRFRIRQPKRAARCIAIAVDHLAETPALFVSEDISHRGVIGIGPFVWCCGRAFIVVHDLRFPAAMNLPNRGAASEPATNQTARNVSTCTTQSPRICSAATSSVRLTDTPSVFLDPRTVDRITTPARTCWTCTATLPHRP